MSKRSLDLLMGGVILLVLARVAPDIMVCGLAYAWWTARRSTGELRVQEVARAAMLGGVLARLLLVSTWMAAPLVAGTLRLQSLFLVEVASMTGLVILVVGTLSLVSAFFLGLAVRLIGPWLPH